MLEYFKGKTIFITGNTGFKGSWLTLWLQELGAHVVGYSLAPPTDPNLFDLTNAGKNITQIIGDIRDFNKLQEALEKNQPSTVFHLAAQPIVLHSYDLPKETFDTNVSGTINLLEAARHTSSVKTIVIVTTDKVYENKEWLWGYRENDPLGFHEPYSTSKAMVELAVGSYSKTILQGKIAVVTARAGNVIGGGDFSDMRLIPDAIKALLQKEPIRVRNPQSIRPWFHVLDALHGYLLLAKNVTENPDYFSGAWNFGPANNEAIQVQTIIDNIIELWGDGDWIDTSNNNSKTEMNMLRLNWEKAEANLQWRPNYKWEQALSETIEWYKSFANGGDLRRISLNQIEKFCEQWGDKTCNFVRPL